jgi:PAS domain-containing protein
MKTYLFSETLEEMNRDFEKIKDILIALEHTFIIAITDNKGTITYVNDKFCEISKYDLDELIGQNHWC